MPRLREERLAQAPGRTRALRPGGAADLRLPQHPLHDRDPHRHLGHGQADPLRAAAARRQADRLGLRLGGAPPPALQPVAERRPDRARRHRDALRGCARRHLDAARRHPARRRPRRDGRRRRSRRSSHQFGLQNEPIGVDVIEMPVLAAFAKEGIDAGRRPAGLPRGASRSRPTTRSRCSTHAASMVDAAYEELYTFLRPGVRENECVGLVNKTLYDLGLRARRGRQRDLGRALLAAPARLSATA